jgi:hypothetical protein
MEERALHAEEAKFKLGKKIQSEARIFIRQARGWHGSCDGILMSAVFAFACDSHIKFTRFLIIFIHHSLFFFSILLMLHGLRKSESEKERERGNFLMTFISCSSPRDVGRICLRKY